MTDEQQRPPRFWFRAKRYGWGWELPCTWQGWAVFIVWFALVCGGGMGLAVWSLPAYFTFIAVMVAGLIGVCYAKGEPPRWR